MPKPIIVSLVASIVVILAACSPAAAINPLPTTTTNPDETAPSAEPPTDSAQGSGSVEATGQVISPIVGTAIQSDTGGPVGGGPEIMPAESVTPGPTTTPIPTPDGSGGIIGQALLGPICPVQREDDPCPDQPYPTAITVLDAGENVVGTVNTDDQGVFRIDLPAGTYTLVPQNPTNSPFPVAGPQQVVVQAGLYTTVIVPYDTGIR